ncbi:MAG: 3-phosphoshikimate 1-carboxyvinyltransferase [Fluviicola sp.]
MCPQITVSPFNYYGQIEVPRSKSYLQRAIAIATLIPAETTIHGFTASNDALVALGIAKSFDAKYSILNDTVKIQGISGDSIDKLEIFCGEAGLSTRMFSPIASVLSKNVIVNGEGSILERPMDMVIDGLQQLGAKVDSNKQKLPLRIQGGINAGDITIDGSESSQFLTGLLIGLSFLPEPSRIQALNLKSVPYVQMTLDVLNAFQISVERKKNDTFVTKPKKRDFKSEYTYQVEGDWSGASFHIVGASISGEIELIGLNLASSQADVKILEAIQQAGATIEHDQNNCLKIKKGQLNAFQFDSTDCPDLFPPLAALAAACHGTSEITGTKRLLHKESNRAVTIKEELGKLGITVILGENTMTIRGGQIEGGTVSSRNDHRIAMMAGILASCSKNAITINNSDAVNKSYPDFFKDLQNMKD